MCLAFKIYALMFAPGPMYLSDATQTYDTDRNTVMEVTQLLIK